MFVLEYQSILEFSWSCRTFLSCPLSSSLSTPSSILLVVTASLGLLCCGACHFLPIRSAWRTPVGWDSSNLIPCLRFVSCMPCDPQQRQSLQTGFEIDRQQGNAFIEKAVTHLSHRTVSYHIYLTELCSCHTHHMASACTGVKAPDIV